MAREQIEVPKPLFGKYKKNKKNKNNLIRLEEETIKVASKYNQYGFVDPTEEKFLSENKGKDITVELSNNKDVIGKLHSIEKYRIGILVDNAIKYYYKHAIISYYLTDV